MIIEMNGYKVNCTLVRRNEEGKPCDCRNETRCKAKPTCPTCMWNRDYAEKHRKELELRELTRREMATLKWRNQNFPITARTLRCLKPVEW